MSCSLTGQAARNYLKMSWIALARISFAVLLSSLGSRALAQPRVLNSFSEIVAYASSGAPILISVNIDQCNHDFPKNLQPYSFTERLDFFILTDVGISSNRETTVNGTRLKLAGPATRVLSMNLDPSGMANFRVSDVDPSTGQVVTSGTIVCGIGSGLTPTAGATPGVPLANFTDVLDTLQAGYRVYVAGDLSRCKQPGHREGHQIHVDNILVYGEIVDHRISQGGSVTFSKQTPFLEADDGLSHGYGNVKLNKDGSVDVFYYVYRPNAHVVPVRQQWKCQLMESFSYIKQS